MRNQSGRERCRSWVSVALRVRCRSGIVARVGAGLWREFRSCGASVLGGMWIDSGRAAVELLVRRAAIPLWVKLGCEGQVQGSNGENCPIIADLGLKLAYFIFKTAKKIFIFGEKIFFLPRKFLFWVRKFLKLARKIFFRAGKILKSATKIFF